MRRAAVGGDGWAWRRGVGSLISTPKPPILNASSSWSRRLACATHAATTLETFSRLRDDDDAEPRCALPRATPQHFKSRGYVTVGGGKIFHPNLPPDNDYPHSWSDLPLFGGADRFPNPATGGYYWPQIDENANLCCFQDDNGREVEDATTRPNACMREIK